LSEPTDETNDESSWPYASLLLFGFFGHNSPGGRKLSWRTGGALVLFLVAAMGIQGALGPIIPQPVWITLVPVSILAIAAAYVVYLRGLDELNRRIQLEAFALAYAATMVIYFAAVAVSVRDMSHLPRVPGLTYLIVFAEPLRGAFLVYLAKKYN
jgi:hypothetical protein